jgi:hypothetical protein
LTYIKNRNLLLLKCITEVLVWELLRVISKYCYNETLYWFMSTLVKTLQTKYQRVGIFRNRTRNFYYQITKKNVQLAKEQKY